MNKPTSTFRLSKPTKTLLALGKFKTQDARNHFKRMMIDAELEASKKVKSEKTKD